MTTSSCVTIASWKTPATAYPRTQVGSMRIAQHVYTKGYYSMSGLKDAALFYVPRRIVVTALQERRGGRWHDWMVDDPPHWHAMEHYAKAARGHVLVAGLGLALVLHLLVQNPDVTRITVVERSEDVIRLMSPSLPTSGPGITIIQDDWNSYIERIAPRPGNSVAPPSYAAQFDWAIVDLWVTHGLDEKMRAYWSEALPMAARMSAVFPNAKLVFHGFTTLTDPSALWPISGPTKEALRILASTP